MLQRGASSPFFVLTWCWRLEAEVNPDCWERWKITGNNSDDTKTQVCCPRCTYGSDVTPLCCSSNNRSYRSLKILFCNVVQTYIVPPWTTCRTVHSCSKGAWKLNTDLISGLSGFINPIYGWSNMFSANVFSIPLRNIYSAPGHATQTSAILSQCAGTCLTSKWWKTGFFWPKNTARTSHQSITGHTPSHQLS